MLGFRMPPIPKECLMQGPNMPEVLSEALLLMESIMAFRERFRGLLHPRLVAGPSSR
jgi:hypothetical protein